MVQAQLKQLDQLREVNKRYHTHTVELKDKIAELIVRTVQKILFFNLSKLILLLSLFLHSK